MKKTPIIIAVVIIAIAIAVAVYFFVKNTKEIANEKAKKVYNDTSNLQNYTDDKTGVKDINPDNLDFNF